MHRRFIQIGFLAKSTQSFFQPLVESVEFRQQVLVPLVQLMQRVVRDQVIRGGHFDQEGERDLEADEAVGERFWNNIPIGGKRAGGRAQQPLILQCRIF